MKPPLNWVSPPLGLATAFIYLFVGTTGPFIAPFFLGADFTKAETIGTKAAGQSVAHLIQIPVFLALGFDFSGEIAFLVAASCFGKWLIPRINQSLFTHLFEGLLFCIAIYLISKALLP